LSNAARFIDGGPEHGEIEPCPAAEVAEQKITKVQRQREFGAGKAACATTIVEGAHIRCGLIGGIERARTGARPVVVAEDRQDPVAHELEHLALVGVNCLGQAAGIVIEQLQRRLRRSAVGDPREIRQIAEPNRGADGIGLATHDVAGEHTLGRVRAEIDVEQRPAGRNIPGGV
jgi:hypothetical protein